MHHGQILVESDPDSYREDKGTTFMVFLPLGKEHLKEEEIADTKGISNIEYRTPNFELIEDVELMENVIGMESKYLKPEAKPIILIVEDNADLRIYIRSYLDPIYHVIEAEDGQKGFKRAIEHVPDLILSDVMMPKMDGFELCAKLKTDERTSHIPVILLTARASTESKLEGLETGADDFITKPFNPEELLVRIKNLIRQRNKLKERFRQEIRPEKQLPEPEPISMDQQFIRKAKKEVEDNLLKTDFNVEDFARNMALSRVQLHRKLKALVDQSATGFIRAIRLNKAAELLIIKSGTISEIAFDVGFNTLPYFTKCFQEYFGVTPSEYVYRHSRK